MTRRALFLVLLAGGCRDYDAVLEKCIDAGRCAGGSSDGGNSFGLQFDPAVDPLTFPATPVGGHSAAQQLRLLSELDGTLRIGSVATVGPFSVVDSIGSCTSNQLQKVFCNLSITYAPTASADTTGALQITLVDRGVVELALRGTALDGVSMTLDPAPSLFVVPRGTSRSRTHRIVNDGTVAFTGVDVVEGLSNGFDRMSAQLNGCINTAFFPDGGQSADPCKFSINYFPQTPADVDAGVHVVLRAKIDSSYKDFAFDFRGLGAVARALHIQGVGNSYGTVELVLDSDEPDRIAVGTSTNLPMSLVIPDGLPVTLRARPVTFSSGFGGWHDAGTCASALECTFAVTPGLDVDIGADFSNPNRTFVTTLVTPGTMTPTGADQICAGEAATRLALPDGGGFVALLGNPGAARLGQARGFMRLDGTAVADTASDFANGRHWVSMVSNPPAVAFWTGKPGADCDGFTDAGASGGFGNAFAHGSEFFDFGVGGCAQSRPLLCVETTVQVAMVEPDAGIDRHAFLSADTWPPTAAADAICANEAADAGLPAPAYLAMRTGPAGLSSLFSAAGGDWRRLDGLSVASNTSFVGTGLLKAPLVVTARHEHLVDAGVAWFGVPGDGGVAEDCQGWSSPSTTDVAQVVRVGSGGAPALLGCDRRAHFMCFQP